MTTPTAVRADGVTFRVGQPPTAPATPPVVAPWPGAVRRFAVETTGAVVGVVALIAAATTVPLFWV